MEGQGNTEGQESVGAQGDTGHRGGHQRDEAMEDIGDTRGTRGHGTRGHRGDVHPAPCPPQGTFLVTQAVARALVAAGTGGSIVHVGSIVAKVGNVGQANYAASKAGVEGLTRSCAKELARFGVRCNAVLPGFIVTPMTQKVPPKVLAKFAGLVPMGRLGDPEEVADVCAFLASGDSGYVTGASVEVTGGLFI
ncbi:estradiol 17-beta-dehydrogenase 8-like [Phaenicophaeus curvirostris]|uniref:estradiol 17-beta-dehydrogenase 8-like n=1 Tax=Phaenicophaeus curvirostris TaxID=33595 RepID=UPI0037F0C02B